MESHKGFTLIELLIVIGVLAILATGLLAAVDPFEQLKKARDANNRNVAIEVLNGFTRYYATHGSFPWNLQPPTASCDTAAGQPLAGFGALASGAFKIQTMQNCVTDSLIADGELKTGFFSGIGSTNIYVASNNASNVVVCFAPEGKALINDALSNYKVSGSGPYAIAVDSGSPKTCPGTSGNVCLQCFQ